MSNQIITATFKAISDEAINASGEKVLLSSLGENLNEYFNLLIEVEWLSGPKENKKGWLLCSHYCKWPETLLEKADFIEGCFTPKEFKEDPRLVLGYHSGSITTYDWEGPGVVVITTELLEAYAYDEYTESLTFQRGGEYTFPSCPQFKAMKRLAGSFINSATQAGLSVDEAWSSLEQRYQNGDIMSGVSPFLFSYLMATFEGISTRPNQALSQELPEYGIFCEVTGDIVTVVRNDIRGGYHMAEENRVYRIEEEKLVVLENHITSGVWEAVDLTAQGHLNNNSQLIGKEQVTYLEVGKEGKGYMFPEDLPWVVEARLLGNVLKVTRDIYDFGWAKAVAI